MKMLIIIFLFILGIYFYLPSKIDPKSYIASDRVIDLPKAIPFKMETLKIEGIGPEDVAIDGEGRIYAGVANGKILRIKDFKSEHSEIFTITNGRPLGLHFDLDHNLIVADSYKGLLKVDTKGQVKVLSLTDGVTPFKFTDDVDIAKDGTIYFTDASYKFGQLDFKLDALEHQPNGRFLSYDPLTKITKVLIKDLYFPNGVAVSHNQDFVLINETWNNRILKYFINGKLKGSSEVLIDNLPGFPDGISTGEKGMFWVAMAAPRDPLIDRLSEYPSIRKLISKLPRFLWPKPKRYAQVLGINAQGKVMHHLKDPLARDFTLITSVQEFGGYLYLGSYEGNLIARHKL